MLIQFHEISKKQNHLFFRELELQPNRQEVIWFFDHVWIKFPNEFPDYEFKIIGRNPPEELLELANYGLNVVVTGFVEDIAGAIGSCTAAIAPMKSGSGMQFKILEAMAAGTPIFATNLAKAMISSFTVKIPF